MVRTKIKGKGKKKGEGLSASKDKHRDVLPRTGMGAGAEFIDGMSKFLAGYGKFITPLIVILIVAFGAYYFINKSATETERDLKNKIDKASMEPETLDELPKKMEEVIAEAEEEEVAVAYAYYRYAARAYSLLERPYKVADLEKVASIQSDYLDKFGEEEAQEAWNKQIQGQHETLKADLEFLKADKNRKFMPWDRKDEFKRPEPKLVGNGENPVVVFVTSVGELAIELYENDATNAVKHFVSLAEDTNEDGDGFFDRTDFSALSFSNHFSPTGPFKGSTIMGAGQQGRPAGVELEKPADAEDDADVDTVVVDNPYTIDYQGSPVKRFEPGSVALSRDEDNPMRARTEFFVVIEPSDTLAINFEPLGKIVPFEGQKFEEALDIARRLHGAEIYYTYVKQKRKDTDYTPRVYYDGWPVATQKQDEVPEPVRFSEVDTIIDNDENPLVVIELESGDIVIELFEDAAPNTVANFINLIEEGFYDSEAEFYRVEGSGADIAEIYKNGGARIIQGGYDQSLSREGYEYGIKNEAIDNEAYDTYRGGLRNSRGTIAMARTNDLHSASTEFFINIKDYPQWDTKTSPYTVFGEVIYGLDLAAQVAKDDEIKSARVLRKRDHKYIPEVKYKDGGAYEPKKPVDIPEPDDDEEDEE